ncbi:MAG: hypothetical protein ACO3N3_13485, partial [bacterium]
IGNRRFMANLSYGDYLASSVETFSNYQTPTKLAIRDALTNKQELLQNSSLMRISSFNLLAHGIRYLYYHSFSLRQVCKTLRAVLKRLVSVH